MKDKTNPTRHKISIFTLTMITGAMIISARNLPMMAETGLHMIFFMVIAALCFFVPVALVAAELATGWPKQGGVYSWVKEAFGERWGFVAIWLQWSMMTFFMLTVLDFIGGSLAFVFKPELDQNRFFLIVVTLVVYWGATLLNLRGMKASGLISTVCLISGVILPMTLIIGLGAAYLIGGNPVHLDLSLTAENLVPRLNDIDNVVLLVGFMFAFGGIEASASHAHEVRNPQRDYPIAILLVVLISVVLYIAGSISVAMVIPQDDISLLAGLMEAFAAFLAKFNMSWLVPVLALLTVLGAVGQVSTWIVGPVMGLLATAASGTLPPIFQRVNKNNIPTNLLFVQALLVSVFGLVFLLFPDINLAYWIAVDLTMLLYLSMYALLFITGIRLRYKEPDVPRAYKVPGGKTGMWVVGGIGLLGTLCAIFIAFFPPEELASGNVLLYDTILVLATATLVAVPFIIYQVRRPSWLPASPRDEHE